MRSSRSGAAVINRSRCGASTGRSKEQLEMEVRPVVERFLPERGLILSPEKTRITHITEGFDFLGQTLRQINGKLLVRPSKKNVHAFLEKVRAIIWANWSTSQDTLIRQLNPIIRGWANHHRYVMAKQTYRHVDQAIWTALWQWAKRRHPKKGKGWLIDNYWHHTRLQRWAFAVDTGERSAEGKTVWLTLASACGTPIRRHRKIKKDANPFDPAWREYFAESKLWRHSGTELHESHGHLLAHDNDS
jgi:RNA-directed DNA polymerase